MTTMSDDLISRQAAIDGLEGYIDDKGIFNQDRWFIHGIRTAITHLRRTPSAQPEIIRCKDCKHWIQTTGKMKGYGLGRCDYLDADLVTCNGFCYWAERRADEGSD